MKESNVEKNLSLHFTDRCNNSCVFCVVGSHADKKEKVNKELIYKFLDSHKDQGYERVNIHGGEATICNEFLDVLDKIKECGYPAVSLQTNGRKLADPEYADLLVSKGVDLFVISVHGHTEQVHDKLTRIKGSFTEAIRGIENVKKAGSKVRTNTVVCKTNLNDMPGIIQKVISSGVDHVNISAIHPVNKAYKNFDRVTPRYTEIVDTVKQCVDIVSQKGLAITLEGFPPCVLSGYEDYMIAWDKIEFKLLYHSHVLNNYATFMENKTKERSSKCEQCKYIKSQCGGVYKEYIEFYGWDEFNPVV